MSDHRTRAMDKLADRVHAMVPADRRVPGTLPWGTVEQEAEVALDLVASGRFHEVRGDDEQLRSCVSLLMQIAVHQYAWTFAKALKRARERVRYSGWTRSGIAWQRDRGGEHHALCLFCRENLCSLGRGAHTITRALTDRWERHAYACALRGLADHGHWRSPASGASS